MKRPLRPGLAVTSTEPILMPRSSLQDENDFHSGSSALHAGHHGA